MLGGQQTTNRQSITPTVDVNIVDARTLDSKYVTPYKAILTPTQLDFFRTTSKTHDAVLSFVKDLNESVVGIKLGVECHVSEVRVCSPVKAYNRRAHCMYLYSGSPLW